MKNSEYYETIGRMIIRLIKQVNGLKEREGQTKKAKEKKRKQIKKRALVGLHKVRKAKRRL